MNAKILSAHKLALAMHGIGATDLEVFNYRSAAEVASLIGGSDRYAAQQFRTMMGVIRYALETGDFSQMHQRHELMAGTVGL